MNQEVYGRLFERCIGFLFDNFCISVEGGGLFLFRKRLWGYDVFASVELGCEVVQAPLFYFGVDTQGWVERGDEFFWGIYSGKRCSYAGIWSGEDGFGRGGINLNCSGLILGCF